jgi:hypothetical protein
MGYLYYTELGNIGADNPLWFTRPGNNWGPFQNVRYDTYWSATQYAAPAGYPDTGWNFSMNSGQQGYLQAINLSYAVAVHPGDVASAVPEPQPLASMIVGLCAVAATLRRRS